MVYAMMSWSETREMYIGTYVYMYERAIVRENRESIAKTVYCG